MRRHSPTVGASTAQVCGVGEGIEESDMLVVPDPTTAWIDPFPKMKTLVLVCDIKDPITHESYVRDPRNIARRRKPTCKTQGLVIRHSLPLRRSSSFLMTSVLIKMNIVVSTISTVLRDVGTVVEMKDQSGLQASLQRRLLPRSAD